MLSLNVTIENDKVIIKGLQQIAEEMPQVLPATMARMAQGTYREAYNALSGKGGFNSYETRTSKSGKTYQKKTGSKVEEYEGFTNASGDSVTFRRFSDSGGYPVPVRTGNLRRLLDWVKPGANKGTFRAGEMEAIVYDSAIYARAIHDGTGSSAKFGARPFITDGFERFNRGDKMSQIADEEIAKVLAKRGFK